MVDVRERVVCLVSGGIDSPVACALIARKFDVLPLHLCTYPYTKAEMLTLTINALKKLKPIAKFKKAFLCPWTKVLDTILREIGRREYTCLVCRRVMLKAAELVCEREGATGIVTGESLGQKATQTLSNLAATSSGIKFPILRPLLGLDKLDIEKMSKKMGIWQQRHAGGCSAVPRHPRTRADASLVDELSKRLHLDEIIQENLDQAIEGHTFGEDYQDFLAKYKNLR